MVQRMTIPSAPAAAASSPAPGGPRAAAHPGDGSPPLPPGAAAAGDGGGLAGAAAGGGGVGQALVFVSSSGTADALVRDVARAAPDVRVGALHAGLGAPVRARLLGSFLDGQLDALVCTDVAARGLDTLAAHVINYDLPTDVSILLHRLGRTARGGPGGGAPQGLATSLVPTGAAAAGYERLLAAAQAGLPDTVSRRRNAAQKARRLQQQQPAR